MFNVYVNPIPGEDAGYGVINMLNFARELSDGFTGQPIGITSSL